MSFISLRQAECRNHLICYKYSCNFRNKIFLTPLFLNIISVVCVVNLHNTLLIYPTIFIHFSPIIKQKRYTQSLRHEKYSSKDKIFNSSPSIQISKNTTTKNLNNTTKQKQNKLKPTNLLLNGRVGKSPSSGSFSKS